MKRLFRIDESEKDRILGMHKSAISRQYLKEQEASSEQPATDGESSSEQPATDNAATEQVAFDCEKISPDTWTEDVKKWSDKILGSSQWTVRSGSHKLSDRAIYAGVMDVIRIIQCIVGAVVDGKFGNETLTKLKEYQREQKIKDDGIVGDITWCKMFPELCDDKIKDQDQSGDQGSEEGTDGSQGDGNIGEMKECLDQFDDSKTNSEVKGGVPKLIQGIDYVFYNNGRFAVLKSEESVSVKGNWKCEKGEVMIKITNPLKVNTWVILIP